MSSFIIFKADYKLMRLEKKIMMKEILERMAHILLIHYLNQFGVHVM